jgi:hypothetical protein
MSPDSGPERWPPRPSWSPLVRMYRRDLDGELTRSRSRTRGVFLGMLFVLMVLAFAGALIWAVIRSR